MASGARMILVVTPKERDLLLDALDLALDACYREMHPISPDEELPPKEFAVSAQWWVGLMALKVKLEHD